MNVLSCVDHGAMVDVVRQQILHDNISDVANIVKTLHSEHGSPDFTSVILSTPLDGDLEEGVFHALVASNPRIHSLVFSPCLNANSVETTLCKAMALMPNRLESLVLAVPLTESQAESFFSLLSTCNSLIEVHVQMADTTNELTNSLADFVCCGSSVERLVLAWNKLTADLTENEPEQADAILTLCRGIRESTSLKVLGIPSPPQSLDNTNDETTAATLFASAIAESCSIDEFQCKSQAFFHEVRNALIQMDAVKKNDLCFRMLNHGKADSSGVYGLDLYRNSQSLWAKKSIKAKAKRPGRRVIVQAAGRSQLEASSHPPIQMDRRPPAKKSSNAKTKRLDRLLAVAANLDSTGEEMPRFEPTMAELAELNGRERAREALCSWYRRLGELAAYKRK